MNQSLHPEFLYKNKVSYSGNHHNTTLSHYHDSPKLKFEDQ